MAQKIRCKLIRNVRGDLQEGEGYPVHRTYVGVTLSSISGAQVFTELANRNYQLQFPKSSGTSAVAIVSTETSAELVGTDFHSINFSFFKAAIQIERSRIAMLAKQKKFCCGPRQGN
jgi:hypothetical protein